MLKVQQCILINMEFTNTELTNMEFPSVKQNCYLIGMKILVDLKYCHLNIIVFAFTFLA